MRSETKEKKKITLEITRHGQQLTGYASEYFPKKMEESLKSKLSEAGVDVSAKKLKEIKKEFTRELYLKLNPAIFSDSALTPVGVMQAEYLAQSLHEKGVTYNRICASPVKRATQTASHIATYFLENTKDDSKSKRAKVIINGYFREKYDGVEAKIFLGHICDPHLRQDYINSLKLPVDLDMSRSENYIEGKTWGEEEESVDDITARVEAGIIEEVANMDNDQRVLIVTHGGVSEAFSQKYGGDLQGVPGKCGIRSFDLEFEGNKIVNVTPNPVPISIQPEEALVEESNKENAERSVREFFNQEKYRPLQEYQALDDFTNGFVNEKVIEIKKEGQEEVLLDAGIAQEDPVPDLANAMGGHAQNRDKRSSSQRPSTSYSANRNRRQQNCCTIS